MSSARSSSLRNAAADWRAVRVVASSRGWPSIERVNDSPSVPAAAVTSPWMAVAINSVGLGSISVVPRPAWRPPAGGAAGVAGGGPGSGVGGAAGARSGDGGGEGEGLGVRFACPGDDGEGSGVGRGLAGAGNRGASARRGRV